MQKLSWYRKKYPLFYFSRFGWSYNRTIQVLFFFSSQASIKPTTPE